MIPAAEAPGPSSRGGSEEFDILEQMDEPIEVDHNVVKERRMRATVKDPSRRRMSFQGAAVENQNTITSLFKSHKRMIPGMFEVRTNKKRKTRREDGRRLSVYPEGGGEGASIPTLNEPKYFVISPYSVFRQVWDIIIASFVLYLTFKLPIQLAFDWESPSVMKVFDVFMDIFFYIDIILNFRTGFVHGHELVMDPREIAVHYLKFWFWIDFLASFPSEYVFPTRKDHRKIFKMYKVLKLARLLRLASLMRYLKQYFRYTVVAQVLFALILFWHFLACVWFMVSEEASEWWGTAEVFDAYFLALRDVYGAISWRDTLEIDRSDRGHVIFDILVQVFGTVIISGIVASVVMFTNLHVSAVVRFRQKVDGIRDEMRTLHLPLDLQKRINSYYEYMWMRHHDGVSTTTVSLHKDESLCMTLRNEVAVHLAEKYFKMSKMKILEGCPEDLLTGMVMRLTVHVFLCGDVLCVRGEVGREMFLVSRGMLEVLDAKNDTNVIAVLKQGDIVGEMSLLLDDCHRSNSVRAGSISELGVLTKDSFLELLKDYPTFNKRVNAMAIQRKSSKKKEQD